MPAWRSRHAVSAGQMVAGLLLNPGMVTFLFSMVAGKIWQNRDARVRRRRRAANCPPTEELSIGWFKSAITHCGPKREFRATWGIVLRVVREFTYKMRMKWFPLAELPSVPSGWSIFALLELPPVMLAAAPPSDPRSDGIAQSNSLLVYQRLRPWFAAVDTRSLIVGPPLWSNEAGYLYQMGLVHPFLISKQ
jgi:hypothetical protein